MQTNEQLKLWEEFLSEAGILNLNQNKVLCKFFSIFPTGITKKIAQCIRLSEHKLTRYFYETYQNRHDFSGMNRVCSAVFSTLNSR
jgi:hypothetical protein